MSTAIELIKSVPVFFYDLICRFIPGGIALYLLCPNYFETEAIRPFAAVVIMWVLGLTIDCFTSSVSHIPCKKWKWETFKNSCIKMQELGVSIYAVEANQRSSILRAMAERTLFRSLAVLSFLIFLYRVLDGFGCCHILSSWPEQSSWLLKCPWYLALSGFVIFIVAWLSRGYELNEEIREAKRNGITPRQSTGISA